MNDTTKQILAKCERIVADSGNASPAVTEFMARVMPGLVEALEESRRLWSDRDRREVIDKALTALETAWKETNK